MDDVTAAVRLKSLRREMRARGLQGWLVPTADPHNSEFVPSHWQRRQWLTGFTGSAGEAVVSLDRAWLYTDARYWLQAEQETDPVHFELMRQGTREVPAVTASLAATFTRGEVVGVDANTISISRERRLREALNRVGAELHLVDDNLVDAVWEHRPAPSLEPLRPHDVSWAGESSAERIARVQQAIADEGCDAHVVTMLDALAWLFNIRGSDVDYTPVAVCRAIVEVDAATLFVDPRKLDEAVRAHLPPDLRIAPYEHMAETLRGLSERGARVWSDPATCSSWVHRHLVAAGPGATLHESPSPISRFKACKNPTELRGACNAHIRDGVAMVRFLCWLEEAVARGDRVSELDASNAVAAFRGEGDNFQGPSFASISAFAGHGAMAHYRPGTEGGLLIDRSSLYLLDSGGQYDDGTTDITRTMCYGEPTADQVDQFTRVLRGHVALARATFPAGTDGYQLEVLARHALWQAGLNYGHGTGHGVGAYLSVHEGPQSFDPGGHGVALEPGMIVSDEPGFYVDGEYGIRIESLMAVTERPDLGGPGDRWHGFEILTLCPIDRRLIDVGALSDEEREFVDSYHAMVLAALTPFLGPAERFWLQAATAPL